MKIYRATVSNVGDLNKSGKFSVKIPELLDDVTVTYVSPSNNLGKGIFFPPSLNSEVLVLNLPVTGPGVGAGWYYLGSLVGSLSVGGTLDTAQLSKDYTRDPLSAEFAPLGPT